MGGFLEESILALLILMDIADMFHFLPPDFIVLDKIVAWTLMGYVLYRIHLSEIFFGRRDVAFERLFLLACFLFVAKDILLLIEEISSYPSFFAHVYDWVILYSPEIEIFSFSIAGILVFVLGISKGWENRYSPPSLVTTLHLERRSAFTRVIAVFFILCTFFTVIFNLMIEWISLLGEDVILVISLILIFRILARQNSHRLHTLLHMEERVNRFYKRFLEQLQEKRGIFLVIAGMLVLHLLTDILVLVLPLLTTGNMPSFLTPGISHTPLLRLFFQSSPLEKSILVVNMAGILLLMSLPAVLWYKLFSQKRLHPTFGVSLFLCLVFAVFFYLPSFSFASIDASRTGIVGVDIGTTSIQLEKIPVLLFVMSVMIVSLILWKPSQIRKPLIVINFVIVAYFFLTYLLLYAQSLLKYYAIALVSAPILLRAYLFVFLLISLGFYIVGLFFFLLATEEELGFLS